MLVGYLLCSCGSGEPASSLSHFTVLGRWQDPSRLLYSIESAGTPLGGQLWQSAIAEALQTWRETGVVDFAQVTGDRADVTFAWRRGAHGQCEPFGISTAVAHCGPVVAGTFIHFDADRTWDEASLFHTALHEIGHVLGLGHSADPNSLLTPDGSGEASLSESELDGLHSLYGGGTDGDGDLRLIRDSGEPTATLRRVAPRGLTDNTLFDTDGDGDDEVLVWRTDRAGNGALMIYHFTDGPQLSLTVGPLYGMSAPGVPNLFLRTADGQRLMVCVYDNGRLLVRGFDETGMLEPRPAPADLQDQLDATGGHRLTGDLDGDGRSETLVSIDG